METFFFFREFLKNAKRIGSLVPSSRTLAQKLIRSIDFAKARTLVEMGAGSGVITKELLARMHPGATLFVFEINPNFIEKLHGIQDKRLHIIEASAETLPRVLAPGKADSIISGLPLSTLSDESLQCILKCASQAMRPNGTFLQFQYMPLAYRMLKSFFASTSIRFVWRNIPPAFVYECTL